MDVIAFCILDIIVGWYLGQDLMLGVVVEVVDVDMAELSVSMSLSMEGLFKKRIGKSMLIRIRKRAIERSMLTLRRLI